MMNKSEKSSLRTMKRAMLLIAIILGAVFVLLALTVAALRACHSCTAKINTENAIQESTYVQIGGIEQYLQIRGQDSGNPVILWLHGGPGFPLTYLNYCYQTGLEKDYTVVCWEQRGCGRTYYKNESSGAMDIDRMLADTDDVVDHLRERFGQEKVIIIGQSWGTVLGVRYINIHPEKVAAYIGVGQVTDFKQGKLHAAECALIKARENQNSKDADLLERGIKQLEAADSIDELDIKSLEEMIAVSVKYLKSDGEMSGLEQMLSAVTSPEMSWNDARWFLFASSTQNIISSQGELMDYMYFRFDAMEHADGCDIPICLIQGDSDPITPTAMAADFYEALSSEQKRMTIIGNAGHTPFLDDREQFCAAVISFLEEYASEC